MAVHPQGHLWVGLGFNRVGRFDGTSWNVYDLPTPYGVSIRRVYPGAGTNEVWLCTNQGLWRFNNGSWTHYNTQNSGLPSDNVEDVLMDGQGRLWVATWSGLAQFNGTSWTVFTSQNTPNLPSTSIKRLPLDNQGRLWVLTWDELARYDGNNWLGYALPAGFYVSSMGIAPNGHVWVAGRGSAFLVRFDGTTWQTFNSQNTLLPITQASSPIVDAQGRLWFFGSDEDSPYPGRRRKGLIRYDGISWTIFRDTYNGLPFDYEITHLLIDSQSRVWLSLWYPDYGRSSYDYYHALVSFDRSTWRVYDNWNSGLPNAFIRGLVMDRQGRLWIATEGAGLVRFDGTNWVSTRASSTTFPNDTLTAIHLDPQNRLWVGSIKGLSRFDGSTWTHYTMLNSGLPDNEVWAIATDTRGRLWVGTEKAWLAGMGIPGPPIRP